jgi:hypothetical protein
MFDVAEEVVVTTEAHLNALLLRMEPPLHRDEPVAPHPNPRKRAQMRRNGTLAVRDDLVRATGIDLMHIDGVGASTARLIISELGVDLSAFPTEKHFVSWLRLAPRVRVSGGVPLPPKRNGMGASRVGNALRQAAVALRRSDSALGAAYRRKARQKGAGVAAFAIARKLAQLVYRALRFGIHYVDIGAAAYEERRRDQQLRSLERGAKKFGLNLVSAEP